MPVFNQMHFVCRAIASLFAQTFTNWQLILINDGSTDETAGAIAPYLNDARILYYTFDQNQGLGAALHYGLAQAQAPFIAYLPADDVSYAINLASLVQLF